MAIPVTQSDALRRENEALRERIAAILRINESLDLETVPTAPSAVRGRISRAAS